MVAVQDFYPAYRRFGSKRGVALSAIMSALANCGHAVVSAYGRFVPKPDVSRCSKLNRLFDHLVRDSEQLRRYFQAKCLSRLEIDH